MGNFRVQPLSHSVSDILSPDSDRDKTSTPVLRPTTVPKSMRNEIFWWR